MDISAIYVDSKLYKIDDANTRSRIGDLNIPQDFCGTAVLYEYGTGSELPAEMATFLDKVIAGGMRLDPARVLTANIRYTDTSLEKLSAEAKATSVIVFGLDWLDGLKNANIRKNEIVKLYGMKVLVTDPLDVININDAAKKAFWSELKKLFQ